MVISSGFKQIPVLCCFIFLQLVWYTDAGAVELSDSARISLLTCAPGQELYSAFGHNGIRVTDLKQGWDVVFNYGTFDDNQPGFYFNFVKGRMIYSTSCDSYKNFMAEYVDEKRSVVEQELRLTVHDKQKIFGVLYTNALPENCNYQYDFFWDNCATRPRDIFEKALGNRLQYHLDNAGFEQHKTMHDMLRIYVHNRPWVDVGFDLILGLPCEIEATPRDQTFLPGYMAKLFACATVDGQPFVVQTTDLLQYPLPVFDTPVKPVYLTTALLILGIIVVMIERKRKTHYYSFDFPVFLFFGLFGVLFLCLWIFTTHYSLPKNLNMLWMIPTHAIAAFFLLLKKKPVWLRYYFVATYVLMLVLLIGWRWNPQPCNYAFAPLIILLAMRSFTIYQYQKATG